MTTFEAGEGEEWRGFYNEHRGGSGNIIMVSVFGNAPRVAMFSSIERAEEWANAFGDDTQVVFSPHVVDEPDFGNATPN
ncbi:hypothetical protein [uncultured Hyphomicrobium sp.]|uniref:hypothetical protein n=1 Tax=uncultured Hyphomicrobium sp. TaxID=194373 RepID=UPI0025E51362|nr:hypothetical protein [uncultured Hyphomicrobium sp.]